MTIFCAPTPDHSTMTDGDLAERAGADRLDDPRIHDGCRIAVALQLEFRRVDAARHVGGEDEKQIDLLGGARDQCRREHKNGREDRRHAGSNAHAHLRALRPHQGAFEP